MILYILCIILSTAAASNHANSPGAVDHTPHVHPQAAWHHQESQHAYALAPDPRVLPPLLNLSPLNQRWRHARRRRGGHAIAPRALQGSSTPGSSPSNACGALPPLCTTPTANTSSTTTQISLSWLGASGSFNGTVITNQCPAWPADFQYNGSQILHPVPPSCEQQLIPAMTYSTLPYALPLGGRIGVALRSGENVYSALEQGFTLGQACTNGLGVCVKGASITFCHAELEYECGTAFLGNALLSDCGTHANPLHMHESAGCEYNENDSSGHSTLVAAMLDGRGMYGRWEAPGVLAGADLDACNGHFGDVPATVIAGVTYPAASGVYHYHVTHDPPYFAACWGPAANLSAAMAVYPGCATAATPVCTALGLASDLRPQCPVFRDQWNASIQSIVPTADCPVCAGACAPPTMTGTPTASSSAGAAPSASNSMTRSRGPVSKSGTPDGTPSRSPSFSSSGSASFNGSASFSGSASLSAAGAVTSSTATGTPTPNATASPTLLSWVIAGSVVGGAGVLAGGAFLLVYRRRRGSARSDEPRMVVTEWSPLAALGARNYNNNVPYGGGGVSA